MSTLARLAPGALDWLLATSWQAAALVLLVLLAQRLLWRRLSPRWRCGLWWIVVARLVLPPLSLPGIHVATEIPVAPAARTVARASAPRDPIATRTVDFLRVPAATTGGPDLPALAAERLAPAASTSPAPAGDPAGPSLPLILVRVWLGGAFALAALAVAREARFLLRLARSPLHDEAEVLRMVEDCRRTAGIRRHVVAVRSDAVTTPALAGFFRPRLLLPDASVRALGPARLRDVLLHEMEHIAHHDAAANWFLHAVLCLHWMNPFAWLALSRLRADRESVRDLGVLAREKTSSRREYGRTILCIVAATSRRAARPALTGILESPHAVKRRIAMITRFARRPAGGPITGGSIALALIGLAVLFASAPPQEAVAEPSASAPPPAAPPPRETHAPAATEPGRPVTESPDDDLLETYPNDACLRLLELREAGGPGRLPEDIAEDRRLLVEVVEHVRKLHEDPAYLAEYVTRLNVRKDPVLSRFQFDVASKPPYILLVERSETGAPWPEGEACAMSLTKLREEFLARRLVDEAAPGPPGYQFRVLLFTRPESMAEYQQALLQPLPPDADGYYSPATGWLVLNAAAPRLAGATRLPTRLAHIGCHQLAEACAGDGKRPDSMWLLEGMADLMAEAVTGSDGTADRLKILREGRALPGGLEWTIPELLAVKDGADLRRKAAHKGLARADTATALFYARATMFCAFLRDFEDGKYRDEFVEEHRAVREGRSGEEARRTAFGKAWHDNAWPGLAEEWDRYLSALDR
ncbi:MAG: M56 family metallopeptidase [Planctomycetes bacterium]|jgi:beta-lactamase regulating signal transducer with metallopeptidase domain|nr:M56 family metallopeptidase [Planctomycetota bacterium]